MKKIFALIAVFAITLTAFLFVNFSNTEKEKAILDAEILEIKMINYSVDTDYNDVEYNVVYRDDYRNNQYIAEIIDVETNEIIQVYTEEPEIPLVVAKSIADGSNPNEEMSIYDSNWDTTYTLMNDDGERITAYVWAKVNVTSGSSYSQVNKVLDSGHDDNRSEDYTLNIGGTFCNNMEFPCKKDLSFQINGVIEIAEYQDYGAGFIRNFIGSLSIGKREKSQATWYKREPYNKEVTFKLV